VGRSLALITGHRRAPKHPLAGLAVELVEVEHDEEIDDAELSIDGGLAADLGSHLEIDPEKRRNCDVVAHGRALEARARSSRAREDAIHEMSLSSELGMELQAHPRIGGWHRAAPKEIAQTVIRHVLRNALPEQVDHTTRAVLRRDTGPSELEPFVEDLRWQRSKMKLGLRVETRRAGHRSRHEPVRTDHSPASLVLDQQVVTTKVVRVLIETGAVGSLQPFAELEVEDLESKSLSCFDVGRPASKMRSVGTASQAEVGNPPGLNRITVSRSCERLRGC
jgi:hypothetical protein